MVYMTSMHTREKKEENTRKTTSVRREADVKIGWIGLGRMGFAMARRLLQAGHSLQVWNRTRSKAEPLAAQGAVLVEQREQLGATDVLFTMLGTAGDLEEVLFGAGGLIEARQLPSIMVDCSTIGADESGRIRERLTARGVQLLSAPVSGNPGCVAAGKLSSVVSGPRAAFERVETLIRSYAVRGVAYVGEGELARVAKLAHN